jgi:hypothetical protein
MKGIGEEELGSIWKAEAIACLRYYSSIYL